jgi:hypothetical protein
MRERFNSGGRAAFSLSPGNWTATVSVINAAGEIIGSASGAAAITAGKTTSIEIPVAIDTSRKDIAYFAITSPISAEGKFSDTNMIKVYVPAETATGNMDFTLTHTGVSISPASGARNFSSSQTFTVTAENSSTKTYTVTVVGISWPTTWAGYGLTGLPQPAGTTVVDVEEDDTFFGIIEYDLSVTLQDVDNTAYESLLANIAAQFGSPAVSQNQGGVRTDKFEKTDAVVYTIKLRLDMNAQNDEITIRADRRLLSGAFPPAWW